MTSKQNRQEIAIWAKHMLHCNALILDTETTGLHDGEIVQIALINSRGAVMLDTLVKPVMPIPPGATAIHGITDAMVADAPGWGEVSELLKSIIAGREVVIYNAGYDRKMMHQSAEKAGTPKIDWKELANFHCAMERYAEFWGDWNSYHQSYRWQKLTDACDQQGIPEPEAPAHSALGDCLRTLALIQVMAAWQPSAMSEIPF
jgi:DNA polymerase-3 subunit epsilon